MAEVIVVVLLPLIS